MLIVTTLRVLVAGLFLLYGLEKLLNPSLLRRGPFSHYLSGAAAAVASTVLSAGEVVVGVMFLFGLFRTLSGIVILALLLVFSAVLIKKWRAGSGASDCGCSKSPMPVRVAVLRNALLFIATLAVVILPVAQPSSALLLLEAWVGALIVGGTLAAWRRAATPPVQEPGRAQAVAPGRRLVVTRLARAGVLLLGLNAFIQAGAGQALAASPYIVHPPCNTLCGMSSFWICVCGIKEWYAVFDMYEPGCSYFCYAAAEFMYV